MKNSFDLRLTLQIFIALLVLVLFIVPIATLRALDKKPLAISITAKLKPQKIAHINLLLNGVFVDSFLEVEGIESKTEIIEHREGGDPTIRKLPGKTSYSNIHLRRGYLNSDLWQWRKKVIEGAADIRKSGAIVFIAENGSEISRYNFYNGWPAGWRVVTTADMRMVEEIELAVEGWEKQFP